MRYHGILLLALLPSLSFAQLNRAFVSTSGSDINPCTASAPCRSFDAAIATTNAGGEILALDTGGYGAFTIDRSVSVMAAPGAHAAITASVGNAIDVSIGTADAALIRGLYLTGLGGVQGIDFQAGRHLEIEGVVATRFSQEGIVVARIGESDPADMIIRNTIARNNGFAGIYASSAASTSPIKLVIEDSASTHHTSNVGLYLMHNVTAIIDNVLTAYNSYGVYSNTSSSHAAQISIEGSTIAHNSVQGVASIDAATIRLSRSIVTANSTGVRATSGGVVESLGNNLIRGNTTDVNGTLTSVSPN